MLEPSTTWAMQPHTMQHHTQCNIIHSGTYTSCNLYNGTYQLSWGGLDLCMSTQGSTTGLQYLL